MRSENEQVHYRTRFRLYPRNTEQPAITAAYHEIMRWVFEKERRNKNLCQFLRSQDGAKAYVYGTLSWPDKYSGGLAVADAPCLCTRAACNGLKLPHAWAMEYDEPDSNNRFRRWHTCIGLVLEEAGSCQVNIKVSFYTTPNYVGRPLPEPDPNIPRVARSLFSLDKYEARIGETVVQTKCNYLTCKGLDDFAAELQNPQRELPLILVTTDEYGRYPIADMDELARSLTGIANVYGLDESNGYLRALKFELFKFDTPAYKYSCGRSTLRIYRPGVDLSDPDGAADHIYFASRQLSNYGRSISSILNRSLGRSYLKGTNEVLDTGDIEWLERKNEMLGLKKRMTELKKGASTDQDREAQREHALALKSQEETIAALEELLSEESAERATWEKLADEYSKANDDLQQRLDSMESSQQDVHRLEDKIVSLQYRIEQETLRADNESTARKMAEKQVEAVEEFSKIPETTYEALELFAKLWITRIVVLPEAYESAKNYGQGIVSETWKLLISMATVLWRLKFEDNVGGNLAKQFQDETSIEMAMTELKLTKANDGMMKLRQRTYNGRTIDITPHVKGKGNSKFDPLRIHFAFDEETSKIVIGHCGKHLPTSGTTKVK